VDDEDYNFQVLTGYRSDIKKMKEVAKESLKDANDLAIPALKELKKAIKIAP